MLSYWEKSSLTEYDLIVIGGGITGLFCALEFRKKNPSATIAVFERGLFPNGASTKNAGFACFGSLTELIEDDANMGSDALLSLVEKRIQGLDKLRTTLGDTSLDYKQNGGYELFSNDKIPDTSQIEKFNTLLRPIFKKTVYSIDKGAVNRFGFSAKHIKTVIKNPFEGQINTGSMMAGLLEEVRKNNIVLFNNTKVLDIEINSLDNRLSVNHQSSVLQFKSRYLAICNNGFAGQFLPDLDSNPGRGLVVLTEPIKGLKVKGCFHYNEGYYYFRNIHNRILFGGGRELDLKGETTTDHGINPKIKKQLLQDLNAFILPETTPKIEMEWSGIMAFGKTKLPIVKKINHNAVMGVRLGGMGVAIGSLIGKETCDLFR